MITVLKMIFIFILWSQPNEIRQGTCAEKFEGPLREQEAFDPTPVQTRDCLGSCASDAPL